MPTQLLTRPASLAQPVEFGEVRLAPTTELVGLAELAAAIDDTDRVATLHRVAVTIRDEDAERQRIRDLRRAAEQNRAPALPKRR
ncbi:MAG: hypothetical protein JJU45_10540 [Acidimicrobiia bacterium]|nr:hypothetical protein [Acidimicrobiia bacterium]